MELIDRYLQAVKLALPKSHRDDIVKELADSILSQVEERETGLGRPLTEDEVVELLRKMGNPTVLAGHYREQQGLIGAPVFPIYWKVLKAALGIAFLVQVIAAVATAAAGRPLDASLAPIFHYPFLAINVFGWVTLVFAALHFFGGQIRVSQVWDPRKLPPVVKVEGKKGRPETIAGLVISSIATVWWLVGLRHPFWIFGPGVLFMTFAPVWLQIYPLWVGMGVADVLRQTLAVVKPYAIRWHTIARIGVGALQLVALFFLIRAKEVFVASDPANLQLQPVLVKINYAVHLGLMVVAVLAIGKLARDCWKLMKTAPANGLHSDDQPLDDMQREVITLAAAKYKVELPSIKSTREAREFIRRLGGKDTP